MPWTAGLGSPVSPEKESETWDIATYHEFVLPHLRIVLWSLGGYRYSPGLGNPLAGVIKLRGIALIVKSEG